jgi:phage shock protein E
MSVITSVRTLLNVVVAVAVAGLLSSVDAAPSTRPTTGAADAKAATKKLSVEQLDQARQRKGIMVVDVRSPEEFSAGHVPGAVNIPVTGKEAERFETMLSVMDLTQPMVVYCRSGVRSAKAMEKLQKIGFTNLSEFPGGWVAWSEAGKPVDVGSKGGNLPAKR